jgi:hypothetical protein
VYLVLLLFSIAVFFFIDSTVSQYEVRGAERRSSLDRSLRGEVKTLIAIAVPTRGGTLTKEREINMSFADLKRKKRA